MIPYDENRLFRHRRKVGNRLHNELGQIDRKSKNENLKFPCEELEHKKMRNLSFLVVAAKESASHQPLLDLMSSNGRPKFESFDFF